MLILVSTITHVDDGTGSEEDGPQVWTMLCGEQCIVFDEEVDGSSIAPPGFDFYPINWAHKANCEQCRRAAGVESRATWEQNALG